MRTKVTIVLSVLACLANAASGQGQQPKEPVLVALTESEKSLVPRDILLKQPDFTATESYFSAREISGFSASSKVARKGGKYRTDTGFVVVLTEPNKPTIRLNQNKTYEEGVGVWRPYVSATSPLNPADLLAFDDVTFSALGTVEVDGSKLLKIQAKSKEFSQEVFLYADLGRKNLITIVQVLSPQRSSIQRLLDISFNVPQELFDISGYTKLPKFKWDKVASAKVVFEGKPVPAALVFRHENFMFVHVAQFEHFLIDLKKKIADTVVYQGLLLAPNGAYIWRTTEIEAISIGEPEGHMKPGCDSCVKIQTDANSFTIPDRRKTSTAQLKVTWL